MDSNNVFSETKLIWSNNLSIGSNPSPPKKTVIKNLIRRKHCWLRRAKEQGRPKIFFPVFLLVQDLPQCKGCAKDVQDLYKYVQGYVQVCTFVQVYTSMYKDMQDRFQAVSQCKTCTRLVQDCNIRFVGTRQHQSGMDQQKLFAVQT